MLKSPSTPPDSKAPTHTPRRHAAPHQALTVCPAELPGADEVDDVQEAVVGLEVGARLAQRGHRLRQGAKDEHVVLQAAGGQAGGRRCVRGHVGHAGGMGAAHGGRHGGAKVPLPKPPLPAQPTTSQLASSSMPCHAMPACTHLPNLLCNLNVGAIHGADDEGSVHRKLHVPRAAGLRARGGDVLAAAVQQGGRGGGAGKGARLGRGRAGDEPAGEHKLRFAALLGGPPPSCAAPMRPRACS
jgi:hypothetical protein